MIDRDDLIRRAHELSNEARMGTGAASAVPEQLRSIMSQALADIAAALENDESLGKYGGTLSRQIVDSWPLGNDLGNRISEFERKLDAHLNRD